MFAGVVGLWPKELGARLRALRERYSLLELCRTPDLATEVTLQPVRRIDVDVAILFSDLLLPLEPMGVRFDFVKGEGPAGGAAACAKGILSDSAAVAAAVLASKLRRVSWVIQVLP